MLWNSALILAIASAFAGAGGCSKKDQQTSAPAAEWPKHGLSEAQANKLLVTSGERTITVGEFADRFASQSSYLQARFESPQRRREFLDNLVDEAKLHDYADQADIQRVRRTPMMQQLIKKEADEQLGSADVTKEELQAVSLKRAYEQAKREKNDAAKRALLQRLRKDLKVEIGYDALADVKADTPNLPQGQ